MGEQVTIWYVDLVGNTYYYTMTELERESYSRTAGSSNFDDAAFEDWCRSMIGNMDGLYPFNGGRINPKVLARVYYTAEEIH